jgi:glucose/arabinose dehydrogenase
MNHIRIALLFLATACFPVEAALAQGKVDAAVLFQKHCAQCHGQYLQGGNAQSMVDKVWQFGADEWIGENIKHGITDFGMPAFEDTLTDDQVEALTEFIMSAEEASDAVKPPLPDRVQTKDYEVRVEQWVIGLDIPWAIDFMDEKTALVTERPGRLRVVENGQLRREPVRGTPRVVPEGQGGMLDVAVDPAFDENGWIYLAYSHGLKADTRHGRSLAMTRLVRGRLSNGEWVDEEVVYEAPHELYVSTRHHYGCRIVFDAEGNLYFSIGDRGIQEHAQGLDRPNGKVHRVRRDGTLPQDNPFLGQEGVLPTIFTYGNRNPQGLAVHPETGQVWESEHGPMGGDEINLLVAGANYGWPEISYGREYDGMIITEHRRRPGMEQPILYYRPSIAVSGLDFYRGDQFPKWRNKLLVAALRFEEVQLLDIEQDRVMHQETILKNLGRVRDVACGPDGAVYVVLNSPGMVLRLSAIREREY